MTQEPIRIVIADDHEMVRYGLAIFLYSLADVALVGEARDGREAIDLVESQQPDIVLMDLVMPNMTGLEAIAHLQQHYPQLPIIALTSFGDEMEAQAIAAGAALCLPKNIPHEQLVDYIRQLYRDIR